MSAAKSATWQLAGIPGPILRIQAAVLCVTTGMGMVYSILALDAKSLGASAFLAGVLLAAFGGMRFVANFPTGIASERFGRRPAAMAGLFVAAIASVSAVFTDTFSALLVCVLFQGLAMGVFNTASLSAIADLGTPESRVRDMAAYQGTFVFGLSLGPALGGAAAQSWGYGAPFLIQGILVLCALIIVNGTTDVQRKPIAASANNLIAVVAAPASMTFAVIFTRAVSVWVLLPLIAAQSYAMSVGTIGLMLTIGSVANLAVLPIAALLAKRFGRLAIMAGAAAIIVAALGLLTVENSMIALWTSSFLFGAGSGIALPLSVACAADAAPRGQTGAAMGLMRSVTDIGMLIGPLFVGAAIDHSSYGQRGGIALCAALLIISTAFFVTRGLVRAPASTQA